MSVVIYTAIFGDYDILTRPKNVNENIKYICFSDKEIICSPWEIRIIKLEYEDLRRENRKYKILSHKFLKEYQYSIYIDGNYKIMCDLSQYIEKWLGENDIAVQKHPWRNCIYAEAKGCKKKKLDDRQIIKAQINKYKKEGYPKNNGLTDNSIIIRKHTEKIKEFNELWWNEVKKYSKRDQLSFNYMIHKLNLNYSIIPILNPRMQHSEYFKINKHKTSDRRFKKRFSVKIKAILREIPLFKEIREKLKEFNTKKKEKVLDKITVIQEIINRKKAKTYLEIGVRRGRTFLTIKIPKKIAVDPNMLISKINRLVRSPLNFFSYYEMTSDHFFKRKPNILTKYGLDVVFIDGLHTYEQSLKDVLNSLKHLNEGGVIIVHDCNPLSELAAFPAKSLEQAKSLGLPINTKGWCGDVWKTITYLRSTRNDLRIFVLDFDHGLGIITKGEPMNTLDFSQEKIKKLSYKDLELNREKMLNLKEPKYFTKFLKTL